MKVVRSIVRRISSVKQPVIPEIRLCARKAQYPFLSLQSCVIKIVLMLAVTSVPRAAHASLFEGEQLDFVANVMSWVVLVVVPIVVIGVFWIIHILPEKIAEKRHHPQAKAIQCLCLMSLVFGGLLWPLAWLWAYSRPVFHKMAYGTDVGEAHEHSDTAADKDTSTDTNTDRDKDVEALSDEAAFLRVRIAQLEAQLKQKGGDV